MPSHISPELEQLLRQNGVDPAAAGGGGFGGGPQVFLGPAEGSFPTTAASEVGRAGVLAPTDNTTSIDGMLRDLFRIAEEQPDQLRDLQTKLFRAGFYGSTPAGRVGWGTPDELTVQAYETALQRSAAFYSAGEKKTPSEVIQDAIRARQQSGVDQLAEAGVIGGGNTYVINTDDPAALRQLTDRVGQAVIGKKPDAELRDKIVASIRAAQSEQQQNVAATREQQEHAIFDARVAQQSSGGVPGGRPVQGAGGIINPAAQTTSFSDTMGAARDGGVRAHKGTDIFAPEGSPAVAPIGGEIAVSGDSGGKGGIRVWIRGDDGRAHYLAHLKSADVKKGQRIEQGQQIGTVGRTGNAKSTPAHIHYSINADVGPENPVANPATILKSATQGAGVVEGASAPIGQAPAPSNQYIGPQTVQQQGVDPQARAIEQVRAARPAEAQATDIANTYNDFLEVILGGIGGQL